MKRQTVHWNKVFKNYVFDKGCIYKYVKNSQNSILKIQIENEQKA